MSAAEILRQVRHICKKLKAGPTSHKDLAEAGLRAILIWLAYSLSFPLNGPDHPAWQIASAPHVASLVAPVRSLMSSSSSPSLFACSGFATSLTSMLISACRWAMYCSPLRCCVQKHLIVRPDLAAWLEVKQQRQQELLQAVGNIEYRRYLWDVFATVEQRMYTTSGGQSKLLGCKVPEMHLDKQWEGRLGGIQGMNIDMEDVVAILWSCFKGHYLLLPAEHALEYLMEKQQQQQAQGSSSSSSSSEDDGKPSAEDFARATRTAAVVAAAADIAETSGQSCESSSLLTLGQQYKSRFDVGCLWLFHCPHASPSSRGEQDSLETGVDEGLEGSVGSAAGSSSACSRPAAAGGKGTAAVAAAAGVATDGVGGPDAAETAGGQAMGVSGTELRLMVNVLLLLWPLHTSPGEGGSEVAAATLGVEVALRQDVAQKLLQCFLEEHCWSWLLLLAAMLQQAPAEAKQQLMKEHGTLLLQLLYRVLLDHEAMGGRDGERAQLHLTVDDLGDIVKGVEGALNSEEECVCKESLASAPMSVVQLVLMVLQGLMFVADGGMKLEAGDVLEKGMGMVVREGEP